MNEDDILKDDTEPVDDVVEDEIEDVLGEAKKKDLIDDDTVSLEDEIDDELDLDEEDRMDDVNEM